MASPLKGLLYGFLVWLVPFVVSFAIFGLHDSERALFESIMALTLAATVVVLAALYTGGLERGILREGVVIGALWYVIAAGIDLLMFGFGPEEMRMSLAEYMKDIGITYLMIPVITVGMGWALESRGSGD